MVLHAQFEHAAGRQEALPSAGGFAPGNPCTGDWKMDIDTPALRTTHDIRLDRLAEIAVRVGLGGLQPGHELVMTEPLDATPLARRITAHAYKAGASLVTSLLGDDEATLLRYRLAPDDSFDKAAGW